MHDGPGGAERAHLGGDDPVVAELLCHVGICFRNSTVPDHHSARTDPLLLPGTLSGQPGKGKISF